MIENTGGLVTKDRQILSQIVSAMTAQTDRIDKVEGRMSGIEQIVDREVYLTTRQCASFTKAVKGRIRELIPDDAEYRELSKKYFSAIYSEIYTKFAVASYREIPRSQFNAALYLIGTWFPVVQFKVARTQ